MHMSEDEYTEKAGQPPLVQVYSAQSPLEQIYSAQRDSIGRAVLSGTGLLWMTWLNIKEAISDFSFWIFNIQGIFLLSCQIENQQMAFEQNGMSSLFNWYAFPKMKRSIEGSCKLASALLPDPTALVWKEQEL